MKTNLLSIFGLTLIAFICTTLVFLANRVIGGM